MLTAQSNRANSRKPTGPGTPSGRLRSAEVLEIERAKPECVSNQKGSENMSGAGHPSAASTTADPDGRRSASPVTARNERTKPEYYRQQEACRNMSELGQSTRRGRHGDGQVTKLGKMLDTAKTASTL